MARTVEISRFAESVRTCSGDREPPTFRRPPTAVTGVASPGAIRDRPLGFWHRPAVPGADRRAGGGVRQHARAERRSELESRWRRHWRQDVVPIAGNARDRRSSCLTGAPDGRIIATSSACGTLDGPGFQTPKSLLVSRNCLVNTRRSCAPVKGDLVERHHFVDAAVDQRSAGRSARRPPDVL